MTPDFKIIKGREKNIDEINSYLKDVEEIYLATDPDREGEAIA
jgi:DNA topoisomerase IA